MEISFSLSELQNLLDIFIEKNKIVGGMIRMVFYRDSAGKYFPKENKICFVAETEISLNGFNLNKNGLNLGIFTDIRKDKRKFSNYKNTNAVISVLASI